MRRLVTAAIATVPVAVLLAGCGGASSGRSSAGHQASAGGGPAGLVTQADASQVLAQYTAAANQANKSRRLAALAAVESASSYRIDAGDYRWTKITDPKNRSYAAIKYATPAFYIPRQASYPAWFVVHATQQNTPVSKKTKPSSFGIYMIFTRASATAKWLQVMEPDTYHMHTAAPSIATDAQGYAAALSPAAAGSLALAPDKLPAKDVAYLDYRNALAMAKTALRPGLPKPKLPAKPVTFTNGLAGLGDFGDTKFWDKHMPRGSTVRDTHATTSDQVFALRTTDGGALVFYDLTASLLLGTPDAEPFSITIPGIFNGKVQRPVFTVNYYEQFAVNETPGPGANPQVVADDSGPVGGTCDGGNCQ
jgi:hypothetical protein